LGEPGKPVYVERIVMVYIRWRLWRVVLLIVLLFLAGVAGYMIVEGWGLTDAVYMTVITLSTVGYGEVHPLSTHGRIFTVFLILLGMGTFIYGISTITAFILEGELGGYLRRKKVKSKIAKLEDHFIVCGSGDIARYVARELRRSGRDYVIVDNIDVINRPPDAAEGELWLNGNPSEDRVLLEAGIERAGGLISALDTDRDNLIVVITARSLNPKLRIVTRAVDEYCEAKLAKAGADAVVSTEFIGGMRMASELVRPTVVSFLDGMLRGTDAVIRVEEVQVSASSSLVGKTIKDARLREKAGVAVVAIKNMKSGVYEHIPPSSYVINAHDVLIVIGPPEKVFALKKT